MQELTLKEIQDEETKMLKTVKKFFAENEIQYSLGFGTVLGAVRHKGFIPWDDDIDLIVPRNDYEKIKQIAKSRKQIAKNIEVRIPGEPGYPTPYMKIVNKRIRIDDINSNPVFDKYIWIDIFPVDHFPDDTAEQAKVIRHVNWLLRILSVKTKRQEKLTLQRIFGRILNVLYGGSVHLAKTIDSYGRKINNQNIRSQSVGAVVWPEADEGDVFDIKMIFPSKEVPFEDDVFHIPENHDGYLRHYYGDYMTPPPQNERARHHIKAYRI